MLFEFQFFRTHVPAEHLRTVFNQALATVRPRTRDCVYFELYRLADQPTADQQNVTISYEMRKASDCVYDVLCISGHDRHGVRWSWCHQPQDLDALRTLVSTVDSLEPVSPYTIAYIS